MRVRNVMLLCQVEKPLLASPNKRRDLQLFWGGSSWQRNEEGRGKQEPRSQHAVTRDDGATEGGNADIEWTRRQRFVG